MLKNRGTVIFTQHDDGGPLEVIDRDGIRSLYFGTRACQSSMTLGDPTALTLGYTRTMLAALLFQPTPCRILLIGLGGGSLARFLLHHLADAQLDCVEIRPAVVQLAQQYFSLPEHEHLKIHIGDGATFLAACPENRYDLILVDAFDSTGAHPSVCTSEFHRNARRALAPNGVLSINLWIISRTPYAALLRTLAAGFAGQILRLPVEQRSNLIALGLDKPRSRQELNQLRETAQRLALRYGLDFPKQLRSIQHYNGTLMRRLLDVRLS